jgi:hypothetical protein
MPFERWAKFDPVPTEGNSGAVLDRKASAIIKAGRQEESVEGYEIVDLA